MLKLTMKSRKRSKRIRCYTFPRKHYRSLSSGMVGLQEVAYEDSDQREMLADSLRAMLRQEDSGHYTCVDYLSLTPWQQHVYQIMKKKPQRSPGMETRIDDYCREQIVEWSFRVVDYFRIDREVVAVSISFLDRFLATCRCDRTSFKLAATTTLHLAVKLLYPCKLADLGILSDLSRGEFDMKDVAEMENHVLKALGWHLHPPTSIAFASVLLDYIFADPNLEISGADLDDVYEVSFFFNDLAVCDYFFVPLKSSSTAIAAILNALEGLFGPNSSLAGTVLKAARELHLCTTNQDLSAARNRLWELYERSEECALHNNKVVAEDQHMWNGNIFVKKMSPVSSSPVSISTSCASGTEIACNKHAKVIRNNTSW